MAKEKSEFEKYEGWYTINQQDNWLTHARINNVEKVAGKTFENRFTAQQN